MKTSNEREGSTMMAIFQERYGSAETLKLRRVAAPEVGDGEVLVRVRAAGLDRGVWHLMEGLPYLVRLAFGLRRPKYPIIGLDVAGVVESVGRNVTEFAAGDEVFGICTGSFAEYACVKEGKLARKPANLSFEQAAVVPISGGTALQAVRDKGEVSAGQSVLITGASGGVGTYAVQIAKALGADVTGVCSGRKMDSVLSIGADHAIDYQQEDFTRSGRKYDVILDIAGNRALSDLRRALAQTGTLVIVGGEEGDRWTGGVDRQLRAIALSPFVHQRMRSMIAEESNIHLHGLTELIEADRVQPLVDRTFPLREVPDAMRYLAEGRATGKIAIEVSR